MNYRYTGSEAVAFVQGGPLTHPGDNVSLSQSEYEYFRAIGVKLSNEMVIEEPKLETLTEEMPLDIPVVEEEDFSEDSEQASFLNSLSNRKMKKNSRKRNK